MARTPAAEDKIQELKFKAVEGSPVLDKYSLLTKLLSAELPSKNADFLAEPEKNPDAGTVTWYSHMEGAPVPFAKLSDGERADIEAQLDSTIAELSALAERLKSSRSINSAFAGKCLEALISTRDSFSLFSAGGKLLVCGWGAEPRTALERMPAELTEGTGTFVGHEPAPAQPFMETPSQWAPAGGPQPDAWAAPPPPPPEKEKFSLWGLWFSLLLLLPLLLLFLLLWLFQQFPWQIEVPVADFSQENSLRSELNRLTEDYRSRLQSCPLPDRGRRTDTPGPSPGPTPDPTPPPKPDDPSRDPDVMSGVPDERRGGVIDGGRTVYGDGRVYGDGAVADGDVVDGEVVDGAVADGAVVDGAVVDGAAGIDLDGDGVPDNVTDPAAPLSPDALTEDTTAALDYRALDPNRDAADPSRDAADPNRDARENEIPQPAPSQDGKNQPQGDPLTMPGQDSQGNQGSQGDMRFLQGCWNSSSRFKNPRTNQELAYYYCFDGKGNANVYADVKDKDGKTVDVCRGAARAKMENGAMVLESTTGAVCRDGVTSYVPSTITCKPGEKQAECSLRQQGVDRSIDTRFTKRQ
jgi:hypothetical protein